MRIKHPRKTRVGLWGQLSILGCRKWYQSRPLVVRYGSEMNQAKAGGLVKPWARRAGSDRRCTRQGQGADPGKKLGGGAHR